MVSKGFRLLVGLGNPGTKYSGTRHNIGFMAIEKMAAKKGINFRMSKKLHGVLAQIGTGKDSVHLLMPNTYMNDSGRSIRATLDWFDLKVEQLLVLADDMDLPLGKLRLRTQGSSGGHKGLRSTIQHLNTQQFSRLKIGIGNPGTTSMERKAQTIGHVLGTFSQQEMPIVNEVISEVLIGLDLIQSLGIELGINHLNSFKPRNH